MRDSRDAWNKYDKRYNLPALVPAKKGERPDLTIVSRCRRPGSSVNGGYRPTPGILYINRCAHLSYVERRKVYSHELGHVFGLKHRPGGVMPAMIERIRPEYPTPTDARHASSHYN
jgi:hypothetical protein